MMRGNVFSRIRRSSYLSRKPVRAEVDALSKEVEGLMRAHKATAADAVTLGGGGFGVMVQRGGELAKKDAALATLRRDLDELATRDPCTRMYHHGPFRRAAAPA